jgi:hypothetical protein
VNNVVKCDFLFLFFQFLLFHKFHLYRYNEVYPKYRYNEVYPKLRFEDVDGAQWRALGDAADKAWWVDFYRAPSPPAAAAAAAATPAAPAAAPAAAAAVTETAPSLYHPPEYVPVHVFGAVVFGGEESSRSTDKGRGDLEVGSSSAAAAASAAVGDTRVTWGFSEDRRHGDGTERRHRDDVERGPVLIVSSAGARRVSAFDFGLFDDALDEAAKARKAEVAARPITQGMHWAEALEELANQKKALKKELADWEATNQTHPVPKTKKGRQEEIDYWVQTDESRSSGGRRQCRVGSAYWFAAAI